VNARPAKVLRIITRLNIGGPSLNAIALSAGLPRDRFDTTLVCGRPGPGEGDMTPQARERGIQLIEVPSMQRELAPWGDAASLARLARIVRRERPDIIHTHLAKAGMLGRFAARAFPKAKTVHTFHGHVFSGYFTPRRTRVFLSIERWLARGTDRIVALTGSQREELVGTYRIGRAEQYAVIPLGFDLSRYGKSAALRGGLRRELGIGPGDPVVAMVGRLTGIKDHPLFLAAACRVREAKPRAVFLVVGDGPRRAEIEQEARALGLADAVRFTGWRGDLERVYADADVEALTSVNEGTPVCLIEAAAAGRPVVSTAVGGVADVVRDGVSGLLAAGRDPGEIASLILRLLDDPGRAAAMGGAGRRLVLGRFTEGRLIRDVADLYDRLLSGSGGKG
jgi:glycosyltransferase involved in cell wall biosynthesis